MTDEHVKATFEWARNLLESDQVCVKHIYTRERFELAMALTELVINLEVLWDRGPDDGATEGFKI